MTGRAVGPSPASRLAGHARVPSAKRVRRRWSVRLFYVFVSMLCLVLGGLAFLLVLSPTDGIRQRLITEVRASTGRNLSMASMELRLFPSPGLELVDAALGPPPGRSGGPTLTARRVAVHVPLSSLLGGRIEPDLIRLVGPTLDLTIDADGRRNWDFGGLDSQPLVRLAQLTQPGSPGRFSLPDLAPAPEQRGGRRAATFALPERLPAIEITSGRLLFRDDRLGRQGEASSINLRMAAVARSQPASIAGEFKSAGERVEVSATLLIERDGFRDGRLQLSSRLGNLRYEGAVRLGDADRVAADGRIELASPKLADAVRWLTGGQSVPGLGRSLAVTSRIVLGEGSLALDDLDLKVDALEARGATKIEIGAGKPRIVADLDIARLDLDQLGPADRRTKRSAPGDAQAPQKSSARRPDAIGALIERERDAEPQQLGEPAAGRTRGPRAWNEQPIAFALLGFLDLDARLRIAALRWQRVPVEAGRALVTISDGVLKVALDDASIHGGRGKAVVTASSAGHVAIDATLDGVDVLSLLSDTGRFDTIEGKGRVRLDVAGHGATERQIVDTLTGTASLLVQPGAIIGWSVSDIVDRARRLQLPALDRDPAAKTPFDSLTAAFKISSGVGRSSGMQLNASPVGVAGEGTIDLRSRTLDLALRPHLPGGGETQAAAKRLAAAVPLNLRGPWDRPKLSADVAKVLKSPEKALEAARDVGKTIKDEDIDKAARKLLGDSPEAQRGAARAKKLLKRFLER